MTNLQARYVTALKLLSIYAPEDEPLAQMLEKHLSLLKFQKLIVISTIEISPLYLQGEYDYILEAANIILLLISADFMNPKYLGGDQIKRILERHANGEVNVFPIILRPCLLEGNPFEYLRYLPTGGIAVTSWDNQDEAFTDIATQIYHLVKQQSTIWQSSSKAAVFDPWTMVATIAAVTQTLLTIAQIWSSKEKKKKGIGKTSSEEEKREENEVKAIHVLMSDNKWVDFYPETNSASDLEKFIQTFNDPSTSPKPVFIKFDRAVGTPVQMVFSNDPAVDNKQLSDIINLLRWTDK